MSLLIIVRSGHEKPGVTSNRGFIESYWCFTWGRPDIKVGGATLNRDAASNRETTGSFILICACWVGVGCPGAVGSVQDSNLAPHRFESSLCHRPL